MSIPLPATAMDVKVREPLVGASSIKFYPHKGRVLSPGEAVNPDFEPTCVSGGRPI